MFFRGRKRGKVVGKCLSVWFFWDKGFEGYKSGGQLQ
jgi:hypothetical protein